MPFSIRNIQTGLYLDLKEKTSGSLTVMMSYSGNDTQMWEYKDHMLVNEACGLVLDIGEDDNVIINNPSDGADTQKWYFEDDFTIRNKTGPVLDVQRNGKQPGTNVIAYIRHGGSNQLFRLQPKSTENQKNIFKV